MKLASATLTFAATFALVTLGTGCAADTDEPELGVAQGAVAQGPVTSQWVNGQCSILGPGGGNTYYPLASATTAYQCAYAGWYANGDSAGFENPCNKFHWSCATNVN
ncbi:MAG: hypothetical protein U0174_04155 [Polyangiaceae bacterium]